MEDVASLGASGDIKEVKTGFAANYLLPKGLAMPANSVKATQLNHKIKLVDDKKRTQVKQSRSLADALEALEVKIPVKVGESDKMFGAITNMDIAAALEDLGHTVDRKKIEIESPIKALGLYTVHVRLGEGVDASLKVWAEKAKESAE
jgi:large subunit ribosomal protein L9